MVTAALLSLVPTGGFGVFSAHRHHGTVVGARMACGKDLDPLRCSAARRISKPLVFWIFWLLRASRSQLLLTVKTVSLKLCRLRATPLRTEQPIEADTGVKGSAMQLLALLCIEAIPEGME